MTVKDKISEILKQNEQNFVSGQEIATNLSVSRNAIWKAVKELETAGYKIESVKNKGYRLLETPDILDIKNIKEMLQNKNINVFLKQQTVSTNNDAKAMFIEEPSDSILLLANSQTGGRGRNGKSFFSPENGIYMSFCFAPKLKAQDATYLTAAAAVAVCEGLRQCCKIDAKIKWVNDIYVGKKKLCGILTEASTDFESGYLQYVAIGIGINVEAKDFPKELSEIATSISIETNDNYPTRNEMIAAIINNLVSLTSQKKPSDIIEKYRSLSLVCGRDVYVIKGEQTKQGMAVSIQPNGGLLVKYQDGTLETLTYGEVSLKTK